MKSWTCARSATRIVADVPSVMSRKLTLLLRYRTPAGFGLPGAIVTLPYPYMPT